MVLVQSGQKQSGSVTWGHSLKLAVVEVFVSWKPAEATNQDFLFFQRAGG